MKKFISKNKTRLIACLIMFCMGGLTSFTVVNPKSGSQLASAITMAALIPGFAIKGMIKTNGPGKWNKEKEGEEGGGGASKAEENALLEKIKSKIADATKEYEKRLRTLEATSEEYKQLQTKIENLTKFKDNLKDDETIKTLATEFADLNLKMKSLEAKLAGGVDAKTLKGKVMEFISKNAAKIKEMRDQGNGFIELEIKAADIMETTSATNPDGIPELVGVQLAPPTNVNLRDAIVDGLVTTFATNQAAYAYTESVPKDGDYAFLAEKAIKPLIDFKIETRYAEPKKIAAHMELTEESVKDIPGLQSIATDFLRKKHNLRRQRGILFGSGIGVQPKGATKYGRLFTAGALAGGVANPNFMDVVNAAITDIFTTHNYTDEMPYQANLVMVNPADFFLQLVAAKDDNGLPLYPMASLFNRVVIGGVLIVPFEDIPSGKIFVADLSKYNITNYVPYSVRIGWINDQFIRNEFCMVGESRLHAFVKKLDEIAFIYDDIANIKGLLDGSVSS